MSVKRILVVDDEPDIRLLLSMALSRCGFEVVCAVNGAEALRVFEAEQLDAVLLDLNMPQFSGIEVCQRLRLVSSLPILLLTGNAVSLAERSTQESGADGYLLKPFDILALLERLYELLGVHEPVGLAA